MREVIGKSVAGVADFLSLGFVHIILKKKKKLFFLQAGVFRCHIFSGKFRNGFFDFCS